MAVAPGLVAQGWAAPVPIQHVIVIMQENRSFDSYFGTFPGANGIPANACVPLNPAQPSGGCVAPFHDVHDINVGGPHQAANAAADLRIVNGRANMDGFVAQQWPLSLKCAHGGPGCPLGPPGLLAHDVMGYHTDAEIPNYWAYAKNFVLQDNLFSGTRSWSLPTHLELVSEWVATCTVPNKVATCSTALTQHPPSEHKIYPWVSLFQLLDLHKVGWKYYLGTGQEPDCEEGEMTCAPQSQTIGIPSIWNPVPGFTYVQAQGAAYLKQHVPELDQFLVDVKSGNLPAVAWLVPDKRYGEHPGAGLTQGMEYVTAMVNAVMQSPYWNNTAIFVTWDEWGGFYDHVEPPVVDLAADGVTPFGYGLRVPGLTISAWAKTGVIDHTLLSFDNYAAFIEDVFMAGARLDPTALGSPDSRPDIRDSLKRVTLPNGNSVALGNLLNEFDFTRTPAPPLILPTFIPTGIQVACRGNPNEHTPNCTQNAVTVSWNAVTGPQVTGAFQYHLQRDGQALTGCNTAMTSCVDVPGSGAHVYRVSATDPSGVASPASAAAEADVP